MGTVRTNSSSPTCKTFFFQIPRRANDLRGQRQTIQTSQKKMWQILISMLLSVIAADDSRIVFPDNPRFPQNRHVEEQFKRPITRPPSRTLPRILDEVKSTLEDCIDEGKFLSNLDQQCHVLGDQGPCRQGQHFILVHDRLDPQCRTLPCPEGMAPYQGKCRRLGDTADCASNMVIILNLFGEGICDCLPNETFDYKIEECVAPVTRSALASAGFSCVEGFSADHNGDCRSVGGARRRGPVRRRQNGFRPSRSFTIKLLRRRYG